MKKIVGQDKFIPLEEKVYLVTDQCFWEANPPENYNFSDPKRTPHSIQLVDVDSGTIVNLPSGSLVKIIKPTYGLNKARNNQS